MTDSNEIATDGVGVVAKFLGFYYPQLQAGGEQAAVLYSEQSVLSFAEADAVEPTQAKGPEDIRKLVAQFADSKVAVRTVDVQDGVANSIVCTVVGVLNRASDSVPQEFVQTFVLAPSGNSYYVHNDFLRVLGPVRPSKDTTTSESPAEDASADKVETPSAGGDTQGGDVKEQEATGQQPAESGQKASKNRGRRRRNRGSKEKQQSENNTEPKSQPLTTTEAAGGNDISKTAVEPKQLQQEAAPQPTGKKRSWASRVPRDKQHEADNSAQAANQQHPNPKANEQAKGDGQSKSKGQPKMNGKPRRRDEQKSSRRGRRANGNGGKPKDTVADNDGFSPAKSRRKHRSNGNGKGERQVNGRSGDNRNGRRGRGVARK